jgi:hypothetical protein
LWIVIPDNTATNEEQSGSFFFFAHPLRGLNTVLLPVAANWQQQATKARVQARFYQ